MHIYPTGRTAREKYNEIHSTTDYTNEGIVPRGFGAGTEHLLLDCDSLLDVGCGRSRYGYTVKHALKKYVRVCDISDVAVAWQRTELDMDADVVDMGVALPYSDRRYDAVTCFDVIEHIPESEVPTALREMTRIANRLVILTIAFYPTDEDAAAQGDEKWHLTIQPEEWWIEQMAATGYPVYIEKIYRRLKPDGEVLWGNAYVITTEKPV